MEPAVNGKGRAWPRPRPRRSSLSRHGSADGREEQPVVVADPVECIVDRGVRNLHPVPAVQSFLAGINPLLIVWAPKGFAGTPRMTWAVAWSPPLIGGRSIARTDRDPFPQAPQWSSTLTEKRVQRKSF
jgi:hypothetical protein